MLLDAGRTRVQRKVLIFREEKISAGRLSDNLGEKSVLVEEMCYSRELVKIFWLVRLCTFSFLPSGSRHFALSPAFQFLAGGLLICAKP